MTVTLALQPDQVVALCGLVAKSDCTAAEVLAALAAYPGELGPDECINTMATISAQIAACAKATFEEAPYLGHSFVLRLVETGWAKEAVQTGVVQKVPTLLQPPRTLDVPIRLVATALQAMVDRLPPDPGPARLGDAAVFRRVCLVRDEVANAAGALARFGVLKDVHDALHLLQVLGTAWLDPIPPPATAASAPLSRLMEGVRAATAHPEPGLPPELEACFARCLDTVLDAERRLASGNEDEQDYAYAALRSMLMQELPRIDSAMFAVSREFPLRRFRALFDDAAAREAAVDLVDTIRRRLMEHGLWQVTDQRMYVIEQALVSPTPLLVGLLARGPLPLAIYSLQLLVGPETALRVAAPLRDAVTRYVMSTDPDKPATDAIVGSLAEIRTSFAALRDAARSSFLETDQALKRDFAALRVLQPPLQALLDRVPPICALWLPFA